MNAKYDNQQLAQSGANIPQRHSQGGPGASMTTAPNVFAGAGTTAAQVQNNLQLMELQARMQIALNIGRPQSEQIISQIQHACSMPQLALKGVYELPRGDGIVDGPSVQLMETLAQIYGHVDYGHRVLDVTDSYTEVMVYAQDLATGTRRTIEVRIKHWRDTKSGGYKLKSERDIAELVMATVSRRVRRLLESIIPGYLVQMAVDQCDQTLVAQFGRQPDVADKIIKGYDKLGISDRQLARKIGVKDVRKASVRQLARLGKLYRSISDGITTVEEAFDLVTDHRPVTLSPVDGAQAITPPSPFDPHQPPVQFDRGEANDRPDASIGNPPPPPAEHRRAAPVPPPKRKPAPAVPTTGRTRRSPRDMLVDAVVAAGMTLEQFEQIMGEVVPDPLTRAQRDKLIIELEELCQEINNKPRWKAFLDEYGSDPDPRPDPDEDVQKSADDTADEDYEDDEDDRPDDAGELPEEIPAQERPGDESQQTPGHQPDDALDGFFN